MKFGKYLASRQLELPEYSGHFIDYKGLKKLIKKLAVPANQNSSTNSINGVVSATSQEVQQALKENKASFFFRVERELDKVNSFYLEKQANLAVTLDLLVMKKNELLLKSNEYVQIGNSNTSGGSSSGSSNANFRNSISYLNLYQNFKKIHQDLIRLQQFIELNETGFLKVVKKWDKRSKSHTKELFILTAVSVQPVFHKNEINELSDLVTQSLFDLESILDGDYTSINNFVNTNQNDINTQQIIQTLSRTSSNTNVSQLSNDASNIERNGSIGSINFQSLRNNSVINLQNNEVDELYTTFVNVATIKDPDLSLLSRWIDKVRSSSKNLSSSNLDQIVKYKLSKIFLLAITNLKISDSFLEAFLNLINYDLDFAFISDDFNNNKNIIHECCSIPPASTHESHHHVVINNGVKVINSTDSINHSRTSIVNYIMNNSSKKTREQLLVCKDFNGRNCLHYAAQNSRLDLINSISLFFPKDHIDDLDNESMSALLLAIKHGNFDVIQKLVQMGSNCHPKSDESKLQYLPINYACKFGDYRILEYLLSKSQPNDKLINQQDVEGLLPLHVISRSGHYKLIKLLIHYGSRVNEFDGLNKWTPLFYAALEGHVKTTQELVKSGAKLDLLDEDGYNVLYYCVIEGHISVLNELLSYYNDICGRLSNVKSAGTLNSEMYSVDGKKDIEDYGTAPADNSATLNDMEMSDEEDSEDSGNIDKNIDSIPDLQLPPPILPLRRYGHNFLEQKVLIELIFPKDSDFINLFNSAADMKPGRITLTSNISDIVPRNILLPVADDTKANNNCIFQADVESLHEFKIDFEIFPKFGTRLIAKTTAITFSKIDTSSPEVNSIQLPLFDLRLRNVGQLKFNYQVIYPFSGNLLETSKFDTYWKSSTSFVKTRTNLKLNAAGGLSPNNFLSPSNINAAKGGNNNGNHNNNSSNNPLASGVDSGTGSISSSFVTSTSLSGEYLRIRICLLNDGTPIVCPQWSIAVTEFIDLYLPNLSLEQLSSITDSLFDYKKVISDLSKMTTKDISLIKKLLKIIYFPLNMFLDILNVDINLNLELIFPSSYELENLPFVGNIQQNLNNFIDFTLNDVFNHIRSQKVKNASSNGRSIIFLSSNSLICKIINWKQPNYPVFLSMNGISYNSKKGIFEPRSANGLLMNQKPSTENEDSESKSLNSRDFSCGQEITIRSIKEAVNFTINNNLIGLIASIHLLNFVPKLIPLIRSRGLILVAASDLADHEDEDIVNKELDSYTRTEINGLRFDDILSFKDDITM